MKIIAPSTKVIMSSRGQLVIPKEVRELCGIYSGTEILVRTREDGVIELIALKRRVEDILDHLPPSKEKVDVDKTILDQVTTNDERTKSKKRRITG